MSSIKNLPDISKWNIENATNIEAIFVGCKSLKNLPDISNWNTKSVKDMGALFAESN